MIHVYPLNDIREHDLKSADCFCNPKIVVVVSVYGVKSAIVVHNAFDAREVMEQFDEFERSTVEWQEELCR